MVCPYCGKQAEWVQNKEVYGKNYGWSVMMYLCRPCDARVGCHQNSRRPLGTMANRELREWRQKAHKVFDPLWQGSRKMGRATAYKRLKEAFGGTREIHIGESDVATCKKIIRIVLSTSLGRIKQQN